MTYNGSSTTVYPCNAMKQRDTALLICCRVLGHTGVHWDMDEDVEWEQRQDDKYLSRGLKPGDNQTT